MGLVFKWLIFVSSYIPVFVMIFLNQLKAFSEYSLKKTWHLNPTFWWSLIIISVVSIITLEIWLKLLKNESKTNKNSFKIDHIQSYDSEVLNYFVTFIIPILSLKPESLPSVVMNMLLLVIEGIYFVSNNALHYNVLLIIRRFHIYTFGDDNIIITKKKKSDLIFDEPEAKQVGTTNIYYI
ncbi:hypothetical protein [Liquorilactobacillus nagelii]|jgi:hypothetical protein|uniref:hypothetical protein n=1 Tax=Liquorilactobacillus nagelii TaxID=82688 RepID=UPI002431826A|nr:hypothetical protein [Liquorilactobacillus nagelii]MCI1632350.1 hypothetical protein [Liquorilactobacillus nagelii]MCI1699457.1 hypothetical protein [Liquorilactobacillus nagelii]